MFSISSSCPMNKCQVPLGITCQTTLERGMHGLLIGFRMDGYRISRFMEYSNYSMKRPISKWKRRFTPKNSIDEIPSNDMIYARSSPLSPGYHDNQAWNRQIISVGRFVMQSLFQGSQTWFPSRLLCGPAILSSIEGMGAGGTKHQSNHSALRKINTQHPWKSFQDENQVKEAVKKVASRWQGILPR